MDSFRGPGGLELTLRKETHRKPRRVLRNDPLTQHDQGKKLNCASPADFLQLSNFKEASKATFALEFEQFNIINPLCVKCTTNTKHTLTIVRRRMEGCRAEGLRLVGTFPPGSRRVFVSNQLPPTLLGNKREIARSYRP